MLANPPLSRSSLARELVQHALDVATPRIVIARRPENVLPWVQGAMDARISTYWDSHPGPPTTDWEKARAAREAGLGLTRQTVYGTLVLERPGTVSTQRFSGDSFYGSVAMVVTDEAMRRATFTPGDTIDNSFASTSPLADLPEVLEQALLRRPALLNKLGSMPIEQAREAASLLFEHPGNTTLVEAQIAALQKNEIAEVRASMYNMPQERAVLDAARSAGIAVPPYDLD